MKTIIAFTIAFATSLALAQTCIVPAPSAPPTPVQATIQLPVDGGTQGCTFTAYVPGGTQVTVYPVGNAKCATIAGMAKQAAANDNGWNDGGVP